MLKHFTTGCLRNNGRITVLVGTLVSRTPCTKRLIQATNLFTNPRIGESIQPLVVCGGTERGRQQSATPLAAVTVNPATVHFAISVQIRAQTVRWR